MNEHIPPLCCQQTAYKSVSEMEVGVAQPLIFTSLLNQVYLLLEFNRQNYVYLSSCLIFMSSISAVAVCCAFSIRICCTCFADFCTLLQATLAYDLSLIGPPLVTEHRVCHLGSTTQRSGLN